MQSDLIDKARESLALPEDYFQGYDDEGITWGQTGIGTTRDSSPRDNAIADGLWDLLTERYANDFRWCGFSHWAHGHGKTIQVRVLKQPGDITEDNITMAFRYLVELAETYDIFWFESKISQYEHEQTLENIWNEVPAMAAVPRDGGAEAIFSWLWDNSVYAGGDDGCWYSQDEITIACFHLGFIDHDYDYEWADWMQGNLDEVEQWLSTNPFESQKESLW